MTLPSDRRTDADGEEAFDEVLSYVRDEMEPHIDGYTRSYLRRRVDSRIRRTDCDGYDDYVELLRTDADERRDLMDAFWINVTEFFRNPEVWERLYDFIPAEDGLRVASVGCADGREAYSLAVLLASKGIDASVTGIDADPHAVEVAREGVYGAELEDIETVSFVDDATRYVEETDEGVEIRDDLKRRVTFVQGNAMDASKRHSNAFDAVLCRNLLIYVRSDRPRPRL